MKCPYCQTEIGQLPIGAVRAAMRGNKMLEIFDALVEAGDDGISISNLVEKVYGTASKTDSYNTLKVTMIRVKERVKRFGWLIESGVARDSATERVYRFKKAEEVYEGLVTDA